MPEQIIQNAIANTQSTHGLVPQAAAALALRLLKARYPQAQTIDTTKQKLLLDYLKSVSRSTDVDALIKSTHTDNLPEVLQPLKTYCPQILSLIQEVAHYPLKEEKTSEQKNAAHQNRLLVLNQLAQLLQRHPGLTEHVGDKEWTQNKFYNPATSTEEIEEASLAQTLHLVTCALFDDEHWQVDKFAQKNSDDESGIAASSTGTLVIKPQKIPDRLLRLESLFNGLLDTDGPLAACATGKQHGLLSLLQGCYLDKNNQPLEAPIDTPTVLQKTLIAFVAEALAKLSLMERLKLTEKNADLNVEEEPIMTLLNQQHGGDWKKAAKDYFTQCCERSGINPTSSEITTKIDELIANLPYLELPLAKTSAEQLVVELHNLTEVPLYPVKHSFNALIEARNRQLNQLKKALTSPEYGQKLLDSDALQALFSAEQYFQALRRYPITHLLSGAQEAEFQAARQKLQALLLNYLNDETDLTERKLPVDFETAVQQFNQHEQVFKQENYVDLVTNFFALLPRDLHEDTVNAHWAKVRDLGLAREQHPLLLTDETLNQWESDNYHVLFERTANDWLRLVDEVVWITSYQINRLLLQALLVKPTEWSATFKQHLQRVLNWLMAENSEQTPLPLRALKQAYPRYFLRNLMLIVAVADSAPKIPVKDVLYLKDLLILLIVESPSRAVTELLDRFENVFCRFVSKNQGLNLMFELPALRFTVEKRDIILRAMQDKLPEIITDLYGLNNLLELTSQNLSPEGREIILQAIQAELPKIITSCHELARLFLLSTEQLSEKWREIILEAIQAKLPQIIVNGYNLKTLLNLPTQRLSEKWRDIILQGIRAKLPQIITRIGDLLELLKLPIERLSPEWREIILQTIKAELPQIIIDHHNLIRVLELPTEKLSQREREFILNQFKECTLNTWGNQSPRLKALIREVSQINNSQAVSSNSFFKPVPLQSSVPAKSVREKKPRLTDDTDKASKSYCLIL